MITDIAIVWAVGASALFWWFVRHSEREFRRGYLLAVDHVEQMTRSTLVQYALPDALRKLRDEMGVPNESNGEP